MTCEEFEELSGAYAVDAVTAMERQAAADHLARCAKCRALLQELSGVVRLLPLTVAPVKPRAEVWERIVSALPPGQLKPSANRRWWTPRLLAVAAALLFSLLGGMAAWNISLMQQVSSLEQQLARVAAQQPAISGVLTYQVEGTNPAQSIRGELLYLPQQHVTVLILHGLPQVQGLQVYQGWLLHLKGKEITGVTSMGLLNQVHDTGSLSFLDDVTGYEAVAVSLEPGPTATPRAPQGKLVAFGALKQAA